jgi:hypothetical protein
MSEIWIGILIGAVAAPSIFWVYVRFFETKGP